MIIIIAHTIGPYIPSLEVLNIRAHHNNARCKNTLETLINPKQTKCRLHLHVFIRYFYVHNIEFYPKALNVG